MPTGRGILDDGLVLVCCNVPPALSSVSSLFADDFLYLFCILERMLMRLSMKLHERKFL